MIELTHLRHLALFTSNLEDTANFYETVWGLDVVERREDAVYFRGASEEHHILALIKGSRSGIHHIAFGLRDKAAVDKAAEELKAQGITLAAEPGYLDEAGGGYGLRFIDPEGRCIELSCW